MIEWLSWTQVAIAVAAGVVCLGYGLAGRPPADVTIGSLALVWLLLVAQVVVAAIAPTLGNRPTGDVVEFWVYLISAFLMPPLAILWALVERSRWSTIVLAIVALAIAVMVYRMHQIWFVQVA